MTKYTNVRTSPPKSLDVYDIRYQMILSNVPEIPDRSGNLISEKYSTLPYRPLSRIIDPQTRRWHHTFKSSIVFTHSPSVVIQGDHP